MEQSEYGLYRCQCPSMPLHTSGMRELCDACREWNAKSSYTGKAEHRQGRTPKISKLMVHYEGIVSLLREGKTYREVANVYGVSATTMARFAEHVGFVRTQREANVLAWERRKKEGQGE